MWLRMIGSRQHEAILVHLSSLVVRTFILLQISKSLIYLSLVLLDMLNCCLLYLCVVAFVSLVIHLQVSLTCFKNILSVLNLLVLSLDPQLAEVLHMIQIVPFRCKLVNFLELLV